MPALACTRAPRCAADYQSRISGPLFDRIDLHVDVPAVAAADLSLPPPAEARAEVAARVATARAIQRERYDAARATGAAICVAPTPKPTASCWRRSPRPTPRAASC